MYSEIYQQSNLLTGDLNALQCQDLLLKHILRKIQKEGCIPFSNFMNLALYTPGLGYYCNGSYKIGAQGDFITAPEISPLFAQCIAQQCQQVFEHSHTNQIFEIGAGCGTLAVDLLCSLERAKYLPQYYYILETSADFKQQQQQNILEKIPHLYERVIWLEQLPTNKINGVILANEVLDAMPVHKFKIQNGVKEFYVTENNTHLIFKLGEPTAELNKTRSKIQGLPEEYESEINTLIEPWINSIHSCLEKGIILLIDYGFPRHEYYHPDRNEGTLMCHYQHSAQSDPLIHVGLQDITAHVDFTAVAEAADKLNLNVAGYTTQADFLLNCGILDFVDTQCDSVTQYNTSQKLKRLLLPNEMGELFKVIALSKNYESPLIGFQRNDMRDKLDINI